MIKDINSSEHLQQLLRENESITVVDFWASWCGPCQSMNRILHQAADQLPKRAAIVKVNVDQLPEMAREHRVTSIPTLIYFQDGQEVARSTGLLQPDKIVATVQSIDHVLV